MHTLIRPVHDDIVLPIKRVVRVLSFVSDYLYDGRPLVFSVKFTNILSIVDIFFAIMRSTSVVTA